jgi:hypothetical protein
MTITPQDRALAQDLAKAAPGSVAWWLGGDGIKFLFQILAVIFLLTALVGIAYLFFQSNNGQVDLANFTTTQGLIAGVLLTAITVGVIVAVMAVLFNSGEEPLKERIQLVRDILAPVIAIFGTIIGFYFGANPKPIKEPDSTPPTATAPRTTNSGTTNPGATNSGTTNSGTTNPGANNASR